MKYMTLRTFTWCINAGATQNTEIKTHTTRFGDGYEQVSSFGINNARKSWQCSKTAFSPEINEIHDFLLEHNGVTPFLMTIDGETKTYRTEGEINKTHISGKVWQLSFNIRQVFVP